MKIAIIKPSSLGDIIQANPVPGALKSAWPDAVIHWVVFEAWKETIDLFPDVSHVIPWKRSGGISEFIRILRLLRREHFDIVIDLQGLARTALLARFSGAKKIIGVPGMKEFSGFIIREAYPGSRNMNAAKRCLETVRYLTGKTYAPRFSLALPAIKTPELEGISSADKLIGIVPFARGAAKEWPLTRYQALMERILSSFSDAKVILLGKGSCNFPKHERLIDAMNKTTIPQLAAVIKQCRIVVGGDTGPMHLAAALDVPVVMLFGGSDVNETAPVNARATIIRRDVACSPCRSRPVCSDYRCLAEITPEEVFDKMAESLQAQR